MDQHQCLTRSTTIGVEKAICSHGSVHDTCGSFPDKHGRLSDDERGCADACSCTKICRVPGPSRSRNLSASSSPIVWQLVLLLQAVLLAIIVAQAIMLYRSYFAAAAFAAGVVDGKAIKRQSGAVPQSSSTSSSSLPDYYQTLPELFPGV